MAEPRSLSVERAHEITHWVQQLLAPQGQQRQEAAATLSRLGVWTRHGVSTRGSLHVAATNEFPEPGRLSEVMQHLRDADKGIRCQVALALGEWGDEQAAQALRQMLQDEVDEEVQLYSITALRTIGGPVAAESLLWAVEHGSEVLRDAAISAIEELATGGAVQDTEGPVALPPTSIHTRGTTPALRTRGSTRQSHSVRTRGGADVVDRLVQTLEDVRANNTASTYVRQRAGAVLQWLRD